MVVCCWLAVDGWQGETAAVVKCCRRPGNADLYFARR
jgi:hypothetical protein